MCITDIQMRLCIKGQIAQRALTMFAYGFVCTPVCAPLCRLNPLRTRSLFLFPQVLSLRFRGEQSQNRSWEQGATSGPASGAADFLFAVCGKERQQ